MSEETIETRNQQVEELQRVIERQRDEIADLTHQASFLASLIDMSVILTSTFELDELIRRVLEVSQRVMGSEASNVMLLNEETGLLECRVALGAVGRKLEKSFTLQLGQGVAGWVAEHRTAVVVPDVARDERFYGGVDLRTGFVTRSILAAPLVVQDKLLGVAEVLNPRSGESFTEQDLRLFETFCRGVAVAVQNAQMHRRLLKNQQVEQQLQMASIIQQGFLPRSFSLREEGRYEIAAVNLPASMVGGDLYDCIRLSDRLLGLTIGDVSGKGVPAALYMARLLSDFRFYAHQAERPAPTMSILNEVLAERSQQGMFVTMCYLTLDLETGRVDWTNGGHIPPILRRRGEDQLRRLDAGNGIPLGIIDGFSYEEQRLELEPGDSLVLFSDGVLESKNRQGAGFGFARLEELIREPWEQPSELISRLVDALREHRGREGQFDDITIMVLSRC